MNNMKLILCLSAITVSASYFVYAACTKNATPSDRNREYSSECNCEASTGYTTDETGQNTADAATCKVCPASTGGCNSTTEHYTVIYEWSYSGGTNCYWTEPPSCLPVAATRSVSSTPHNNSAKYEYLTSGCGT